MADKKGTLCLNGPSCKYYLIGRCNFFHPELRLSNERGKIKRNLFEENGYKKKKFSS